MIKRVFYSLCFMLCTFTGTPAYAEEPFDLTLKLDFSATKDNYAYRAENEKRVKSLLLFGVFDENKIAENRGPAVKFGKDLGNFFKTHIDNAKNGLEKASFSQSLDWYAGEKSFLSEKINQGIDVKPAKLAGFSVDFGNVKVGGGYTWGEKNPAFLDNRKRGMILGASFSADKWEFQTSVLAGGSNPYNFASDIGSAGVMFGATRMVTEKRGYTASVQYGNGNAVLLTVGTKIKF